MASQDGTNQDQTVSADIDTKLQTQTMFETLARLAECSQLFNTVREAELDYALRRSGLRTLLAPTNEAFAGISAAEADDFLTSHLLNGAFETFDLRHADRVKALDGSVLPVHNENGVTTIGGAQIVRADIPCTNGVIQVINGDITSNKANSAAK